MALRVNGADAGAATGQGYARSASAAGSPFYIGGSTSQQDLLGDIAEVIAVKGPLSDGDVSGVEAYSRGKYGL